MTITKRRHRSKLSVKAAFLTESLLTAATGVQDFHTTQTAVAAALFGHLATALGVAAPEDESEPFGARWYRYQAAVIRTALDGRARALLGVSDDRAWAPCYEARRGEASLVAARMVPVLDPNFATESELADLPGFGQASAARVIAARRRKPFATLEAVRKAAKLSPTDWEPAAPRLAIGAPSDPADVVVASGALRALVDGVQRGVFRHPAIPNDVGPTATAMAALEHLSTELIAQRMVPPYWVPSPDRMRIGLSAVTRATPTPYGTPRVVHSATSVALLRNAAYHQLLCELLADARARVRVTMFFLAVNKKGVGPASDLVALLAAARARGADVRVLIADTLPNDVRSADQVNEYAFGALRRARVPFRRYWPEIALHEKSVIVDGRHVVVGSHNWTASSFFRYDETSVYADAPRLAAQLERRFDERWALLADIPGRRRAPLGALESFDRGTAEALRGLDYDTTHDLPESAADLRTLARAVGSTAARLSLARRMGTLMCALRVSEVTAAMLAVRGFDTEAKVRRASLKTLRGIFETPGRLPAPLDGRSINRAIADRLTEIR